MPNPRSGVMGNGWPSPTGATTPVVPMPVSPEEAAGIVEDETAPPSDHLEPGDAPGNQAVTTLHSRSPVMEDLYDPDKVPVGRPIEDILADWARALEYLNGVKVREIRPTRFATMRIPLAPGVTAKLVAREQIRNSIRIRVIPTSQNPPTVFIGNNASVLTAGYALFSTNEVELHHTDEIWVGASPLNMDPCEIHVMRELLN